MYTVHAAGYCVHYSLYSLLADCAVELQLGVTGLFC